jgi:ribosomal protein S18 acetylase RimI-like enzyme
MRRAHVRDLPGIYRVCLQTGAAGHDATPDHADPDLLGHVWAGPYLAYPGALALVVHDDEGIAGYAVGVPDTARFEDWLAEDWLPPLRFDHPAGSGSTVADRALVDRLHAWPRTDTVLLHHFPAHLHVDLLPRLQGRGWGRRLVESLLDALARDGAVGAHLGVDPANPGAVAFYERLGFRRLASDRHGGTVLGTDLTRDRAAEHG